jgi:hypothetical protein
MFGMTLRNIRSIYELHYRRTLDVCDNVMIFQLRKCVPRLIRRDVLYKNRRLTLRKDAVCSI